uniref:Ig-like domain-containing protein n=1 Tax=Tetraodon nigroviridis TaxID=99883 RepID=H3CIL5_TETNG
YAFGYWGKGTLVTVSSATPKSPSVFPLMECGSVTRNMVTLGCLATDFTPSSLTYSWSKSGAALTDFIQYPPTMTGNYYTGISQISVNRNDWDNGDDFKCVAAHSTGNVEATLTKPIVDCQLPTVSLSVSSADEQETVFACLAKDFSPKNYEVKWFRNGKEVTSKISNTPVKEESKTPNGTLYSAASFLTVSSSD